MIPKNALRAEARKRRAQLSADLPGFAQAIACHMQEIALAPHAAVATYWPIRDEADPRGLAAVLAAHGYPVLLPCIVGAAAPLIFRHWREGDAVLLNVHGVPEPAQDAEALEPDVVFVPLLAFDAEGYRLGYGGGYYDRTLAGLRARRSILAIGIAYAGQETPSLPHATHDEALDMVLTEKGLRRFAGR